MGIGPHAIKLTRILHESGLLKAGFSVIELGSQDFAPTLSHAQLAIKSEFGFSRVDDVASPADLYRRIGASRYDCIDLDGYHGAHVFDLNVDVEKTYDFGDQFDLVTNHGTTEHLFNQTVAFCNVHKFTAVGGVMLHALPFQGYQNHGMFNYNPSLFLDLALANGYEVFGLFLSIDDKLYAYDQEFLARNNVTTAQDTLLLAALIKKSDDAFAVPYDGRYFATHGKGEVTALTNHVGTTRRSYGSGRFEITGLDEITQSAKAKLPPIRFITPLWGTDYVDVFLSVALPSQLSGNNLRSIPGGDAIYTIVTTAQDAALIQRSQRYSELAALMPVEFIFHQSQPGQSSYERMTYAYNLALERVAAPQTCFFLTADDFYSDGLFSAASAAISAGKRVVMVPTIRVVSESFRAELESQAITSLAPAALAARMLRHEHPMITACVVNDKSRVMHRLPAQTLARTKHGYVGRWNVMHPLVIKLPANPRPATSTVDWNYPALFVSHSDDVHVIRNSDEGAIASLTPYSYSQSEDLTRGGSRGRRIRNLKNWVEINWALNFHVLQMSEPVIIHTGSMSDADRLAAQKAVDAVWKPFYRYVERRSAVVPESAKGYGLDLLTRAVRPNAPYQVMALAARALQRALRKFKRRVYHGVRRRLS